LQLLRDGRVHAFVDAIGFEHRESRGLKLASVSRVSCPVPSEGAVGVFPFFEKDGRWGRYIVARLPPIAQRARHRIPHEIPTADAEPERREQPKKACAEALAQRKIGRNISDSHTRIIGRSKARCLQKRNKSLYRNAPLPDNRGTMQPIASFSRDDILSIITQHLGATLSIYDRNLRFVYVSESFARWFGRTPEQMVGCDLESMYGPQVFAGYKLYIDRALAGESLNYERLLRSPAGEETWRTISLVPWRNANGEIVGVVNSALSVHELKTTTEALRVANQRLQSHMDNSPLAVIEFDADLKLTHWSPRARTMFGWTAQEAMAMPLTTLFGEQDREESHIRLAFRMLQRGESANNRVEAAHRRNGGSLVHCEWFNSALTDRDGKVTSIMSLVEDVSSRVQAAEQLRYIAEHDSLTGLPNRAALHAQVDRALRRAARTMEHVALLFLDLDGFKAVNDTYGHGAGDEVLKEVARRLKGCIRATDTVARLGGDEFVVLLEGDVTDETPAAVGERILDAMRVPFYFSATFGGTAIQRDGEALLGASIGIATHPPIETHADSLFKRADAAMYVAKRAGKGRVCFADAD
jgi:diguanylate cyclase (GGDEF)-like protein/PAS domain S-box-containing protein